MLSNDEIIEGFRKGDNMIIREYFYGYCRIGYNIFDKIYQLSSKANLDFMSLAHQYILYLMEHDWKPLEDHSPEISLKTWLINGFRFVVLDALKWYRKEYGNIPFVEFIRMYDMPSNLRLQFNKMIQDLCDHASISQQDKLIIDMLLREGYMVKEVAEKMGVTPSAISQKFKLLKETIIFPYFRMYFNMDFDMQEVIEITDRSDNYSDVDMDMTMYMPSSYSPHSIGKYSSSSEDMPWRRMRRERMQEFITSLKPNEIFVFGSNLKGLHLSGTAYQAYRKFGAVPGQGVGLQGQSYAIPTMQGGVETIRPYVDDFFAFAKEHPQWEFLVTRIGCGIEGFTDMEIFPLFAKAHNMKNIVLPAGW